MKQPNLVYEIIVDCFAGGVTVASLFDGIGGTPLSARINGAECLWCSEVEPFPVNVTKHHFPNMKHYGDITKINGAEVEPVDIIVGGSPCQDLSVAGKRAGMKHSDFGDEEATRSGLFMEQIRIIKEMRNASDGGETIKPRFMVWENVPGAFSSNKGEDFRIVLEETAKIKDKTVSIPRPNGGKWSNAGVIVGDGFSIAWRTVDAQFWGVAQRRRRIYLVADFGGESASEILFEREGVSGDSSESRSTREGTADDVERGTITPKLLKIRGGCEGGGKVPLIQDNKSATLSTLQDQTLFDFKSSVPIVLNDQGGSVMDVSNKAATLRAEMHGHVPVFCFDPGGMVRDMGVRHWEEISPTLRAEAGDNQPAICLQGSMIGRADKNGPQGNGINEDVSFTLNTTDRHAVCYGISSYESNAMKSSNPHSGVYEADTSRTLDINGGNPACNQGGIAIVQSEPYCIEMTSTKNTIVEDGICPTLTARMGTGGNQVNAVCSSVGGFMQVETERTPTLMARDYKDPHIVSRQNKQVRRLTPLETERLQGYLDGWTDIPPQKEVSVDELRFWRDVWDEWDTMQDHKKHSDKQIIKWLQSESADASRYKANGNSFAIPNASFVIGRCITTMREFRARVREEAL